MRPPGRAYRPSGARPSCGAVKELRFGVGQHACSRSSAAPLRREGQRRLSGKAHQGKSLQRSCRAGGRSHTDGMRAWGSVWAVQEPSGGRARTLDYLHGKRYLPGSRDAQSGVGCEHGLCVTRGCGADGANRRARLVSRWRCLSGAGVTVGSSPAEALTHPGLGDREHSACESRLISAPRDLR